MKGCESCRVQSVIAAGVREFLLTTGLFLWNKDACASETDI